MTNYTSTIRKFEKNYDKKAVRTLSDMVSFFKDKEAVRMILKKKDPVLYTVFIKEFSPIDLGLIKNKHLNFIFSLMAAGICFFRKEKRQRQ